MMHKIFSILSFILLYVAIAFGQAAVDNTVLVYDNAGNSKVLNFGLDLTATDGIDPLLGESDLPPPPPGNAFDTRWWIPPFAGALSTWLDYRAPGDPPAFPFTGPIEHIIKFQSTDFPITITWDLPGTIHSSSVIKDPFNMQVLSFSGTDSMIITLSAIPYVEVTVEYLDVVPVELTSFTAEVTGLTVVLNWTTATELNNQGFEIERQAALGNWEKIGYVVGFGTTTETKSYSFVDANVVQGTYSYRLKQIDYDGTFSYSNEIEVDFFAPNDFALFQNYPNPFNPTTAVKFQMPETSNVTVKIYDMLGQEIRTLFTGVTQKGTYTVQWDGLNDTGVQMSSGSYIYKMVAGDFVQSKKMVLLK